MNKLKNAPSAKKPQVKIETIIDGNNDSFINELADLLNNVDGPVNKKDSIEAKYADVPEKNIKINLLGLENNFDNIVLNPVSIKPDDDNVNIAFDVKFNLILGKT
jgi:hypothetical protein